MKHYASLDRTESLKRMIPNLFDMDCLYIGAREDRADYLKDFKRQPDILEIWEPNCVNLRSQEYVVFSIDVRDASDIRGYFDVVFWWHGPEHIKKKELAETLKSLEKIASKAVVLGCPWGYFKNGEFDNPYEKHLSHHSHPIFERLGYQVECLGTKNKRGSNLTAVKWI